MEIWTIPKDRSDSRTTLAQSVKKSLDNLYPCYRAQLSPLVCLNFIGQLSTMYMESMATVDSQMHGNKAISFFA